MRTLTSSTPASSCGVDGDDVWIRIDSVQGPCWRKLLSDHWQWYPPWLWGCGCGSSLVAERQEWSWLVRSSWSTLLRSGWSSRWCRLCAGAACRSWWLLEEFPLLRCLPCRMGVACGVQRIGFFGRSCVHLTWFDSGHMFLERPWNNFHIFYVAVNSNPEAFGFHSFRMEKRAQSMLLVAVSLSAVRTFGSSHYFYERSIFDSLRQFSRFSAAFFGALDDEEFSQIEGSCQLDRDALST